MRFLSIYNESIYIFGCGLQVKYLMDCIKYMFPIKDRIPYFIKCQDCVQFTRTVAISL